MHIRILEKEQNNIEETLKIAIRLEMYHRVTDPMKGEIAKKNESIVCSVHYEKTKRLMSW